MRVAAFHSQPRQRGLDQEPRFRVPAHLSVQVQQRVENARQPPRRRLVVPAERGDQPVPAPFHQPPHDLPQLRPHRVDAVQLRQRLRGAAREDVVEQRIEQSRIGDAEERSRRLERYRPA